MLNYTQFELLLLIMFYKFATTSTQYVNLTKAMELNNLIQENVLNLIKLNFSKFSRKERF